MHCNAWQPSRRRSGSYMQAWDAVHVACGLPQLVYARLDVARFRSIYATRGRWALLDQLASLPAGTVDASQAPADETLKNLGTSPGAPQGAARRAAAFSLGALEGVVRRLTAAVLGPDAAEGAHHHALSGRPAGCVCAQPKRFVLTEKLGACTFCE